MKKIIGIGLVLILLIVGVSFFINNPINTISGDELSQGIGFLQNPTLMKQFEQLQTLMLRIPQVLIVLM